MASAIIPTLSEKFENGKLAKAIANDPMYIL
jgi:hypothetical protein